MWLVHCDSGLPNAERGLDEFRFSTHLSMVCSEALSKGHVDRLEEGGGWGCAEFCRLQDSTFRYRVTHETLTPVCTGFNHLKCTFLHSIPPACLEAVQYFDK